MSLFKIILPAQCDLEYSIQAFSKEEALELFNSGKVVPISTTIVKQDMDSLFITELPHQYRVSIAESIVFKEYTLFADSPKSAIDKITKTTVEVSGSHTEQNDLRIAPIVEVIE